MNLDEYKADISKALHEAHLKLMGLDDQFLRERLEYYKAMILYAEKQRDHLERVLSYEIKD